jgi:hypothetical protein
MLLDAIPLSEVLSIDLMKNIDQKDLVQQQPKNSFEAVIDFTNAFQIRTRKDGQNAGRKYFLRAESEDQLTTTISDLSRLAKIAAEKSAARTKWEELQRRMREVYGSAPFQGISALLIVGVIHPAPKTPKPPPPT